MSAPSLNLSASQKSALLTARKRKRIFRTAYGPWRAPGTANINHATIRGLIGRGLLEERNSPSLHVIPTPAGAELAAEIERRKRRG
ncbi:hypothetical protein MKI84_13010 [Ancylobacter sp. A5.8]|uniref:hypothetical protein n=1 Tax=Ancylobacter gelatini TaxID=2919920 RepID=UPI001F4D9C1B|nr:hypothetical protein [Ancylobacter gelatini]MCJ8143837.1 hypothetical protein [Ancylobacter gelatini]